MKVEIMTSGEFEDVIVDECGMDATCVYRCPEDIYNDHPYYEIWSVEKSDIKKFTFMPNENSCWFRYSTGANRGTAYDCITINGVLTMAWLENSKKDTFNCLTDYFRDCLGVTDSNMIYDYSVYLAKCNGWTLSEMWKKLEG